MRGAQKLDKEGEVGNVERGVKENISHTLGVWQRNKGNGLVCMYPSIRVKTFVVRQERCIPIYEVKKGATRPKAPKNAVVCVRF